ncbi:hypothetical protein BaRGS_00024132 [Batillaria attramentaria]|uniref:Uncharacterized protein n=1 Tax=Batillaria attramentaria TaxID=370345 RepID=A0ABD0KC04_9CAEN
MTRPSFVTPTRTYVFASVFANEPLVNPSPGGFTVSQVYTPPSVWACLGPMPKQVYFSLQLLVALVVYSADLLASGNRTQLTIRRAISHSYHATMPIYVYIDMSQLLGSLFPFIFITAGTDLHADRRGHNPPLLQYFSHKTSAKSADTTASVTTTGYCAFTKKLLSSFGVLFSSIADSRRAATGHNHYFGNCAYLIL